ncbi:DNA-binding transcriptional response regulator [Gluconacetobacter takamatsuzukensis]|uniref:DNA-binding response regulator n=1 Tax=Gluconacetobacter takamatsuzukensis TaxID=1286190 RepID=A0A7W4KGZ7_9PROT|nr:DNA-binding response regulator [Gluconacetobacter takamatsuzukensis]MBB2206640.1 DNA-binding response regulator [Gluconacetobacter takamatsuzukensis]
MTSGRHILLVEDESAIADLICTALEASDLRVTACAGVQPALETVELGPIALAIVDLSLPDGPPDRLIARLKAGGVPLIAISGDPAGLAALAPIPTLEKPFRIRALMDLVHTTLDGAAG